MDNNSPVVYYPLLSYPFKNELEKYLQSGVSYSTQDKAMCAHFLLYLEEENIHEIADITLDNLISVVERILIPGSNHATQSILSSVKRFFMFEEQQGQVEPSFPLLLKYLPRKQILMWDNLSTDAQESIFLISKNDGFLNPRQYHDKSHQFISKLIEMKYCEAYMVFFTKTTNWFYLFLDINHLNYHPKISYLWMESAVAIMSPYKQTYDKMRRFFKLFEKYVVEGTIEATSSFRFKILPYDVLPPWCKKPLDDFLQLKRMEGWEKHTVQMFRSSIVRFCTFLVESGLTSFAELTPEVIKAFNIQDHHKTSEGKNAYNCRIRRFLIYLGEKQLSKSGLLFLSLPCRSAPKERIVITLTDNECQELKTCIASSESPLSLRDKTILLLGRHLAMRESDILNIKFTNIDWKNRTLSFVQEKTDVELVLPFPNNIGNAIYRYIMEERPDTDSPYLFIREVAPYEKVGICAAGDAFNRALPDRHIPGSSFHVLRKTRASEMLKAGVKPSVIGDVMGHQSLNTIRVYLSLDDQRMLQCPISLSEAGICMKEVFPDA